MASGKNLRNMNKAELLAAAISYETVIADNDIMLFCIPKYFWKFPCPCTVFHVKY